MKSKEARLIETLTHYHHNFTGWQLVTNYKPYSWYHVKKEGEIPPHIAVSFHKDIDVRNLEPLFNVLNNQWDEQLIPSDYPDYRFNIYYIDIED